MKLTIQKVVTETHEVDITFPAYYKLNDWDYYIAISPEMIFSVYLNNGYLNKGSVLNPEAKLIELHTKGKQVTEQEFAKIYIKACEREAEYLPCNDNLLLFCKSATLKQAV